MRSSTYKRCERRGKTANPPITPPRRRGATYQKLQIAHRLGHRERAPNTISIPHTYFTGAIDRPLPTPTSPSDPTSLNFVFSGTRARRRLEENIDIPMNYFVRYARRPGRPGLHDAGDDDGAAHTQRRDYCHFL